MKTSPPRLLALLPLAMACFAGQAEGAAAVQDWYGGNLSSHQAFFFSSDDPTPAPDQLTGSFGAAGLTVSPGFAASGWQDPGAAFTSPGIDDDGAWDLGNQGFIEVTLPVAALAAEPGTSYKIDFLIYVSGMVTPTSLPALDTMGLTPQDLVVQTATGPADGELSRWDNRTWTGSFEGVTDNAVTFRIQAPTNGSVIDSFEVYTNVTVVPEPSFMLLGLLAGLPVVLRRRRN